MSVVLRLAWRNLVRHARKSLLLAGLVAAGVGTLYLGNALFRATARGLEASLVRSLTGDLVLAAAGQAYGLFGSELPIASEYETVPPLPGYAELSAALPGLAGLASWAPVVSAAARVEAHGLIRHLAVFGVRPDDYFQVCSDLRLLWGDAAELSRGGVFLNERAAASLAADLGRPLGPGEPLTLSLAVAGEFRVRRAYLAGVYAYPAPSEALDRVCLADAALVRSLLGYALGNAAPSSPAAPGAAPVAFDLDGLFADAGDTAAELRDGVVAGLEGLLAAPPPPDTAYEDDAGGWSFVLLRAEPGAQARLARQAAALARRDGAGLRLMSWRRAAGLWAQALFGLQAAFYVGVAFLALGAVLVIMNALVLSVLERVPEIGTMRALGAGAGFIRALFVAESVLLTLIGGAAGVAAGAAAVAALSDAGLGLTNPLLISLFGGAALMPEPAPFSAVTHVALAAAAGALAWIYPVALALRVRPAGAMGRG